MLNLFIADSNWLDNSMQCIACSEFSTHLISCEGHPNAHIAKKAQNDGQAVQDYQDSGGGGIQPEIRSYYKSVQF